MRAETEGSEAPRVLFVGLGSPHGDDQVGWHVAETLRPAVVDLPHICVRIAVVPLDLLDWLEGVDCLYICDACSSDAPPGCILRMTIRPPDCETDRHSAGLRLPMLRCEGSHDFGLGAVLKLAQRLDRLPQRVVLHAVSGCQFGPGEAMIGPVVQSVPRLVHSILEELSDARDLARAVAAAPG